MKQHILRFTLLTLVSTHTLAATLDAELAIGHDSNPFTLADQFNPDSAMFIDTKLRARQHLESIRLTAQIDHRAYDGLSGNGDNTMSKLEARYRTRYKIADNKTISYLSLEYADRDKTYVSHATGLPGSFASQSIEDRYDYSRLGVKAKTNIYLDKKLKTDITLEIQSRDYQDYNIPGLSDFDYQQIDLSNGWSYQKDDKNTFEFDVKLSQRVYDDKRERDLIGDTIAGTDLEYDMYSVSIAHEHIYSKKYLSEIKLYMADRSDSGPGYYDTSDLRLTALLRYSKDSRTDFDTSLTYRDYEYDNNVIIDPNDEGNPGKQGYTLRFKMNKQIDLGQTPGEFFAGLRYDDYDSNDSNYIYDRAQVFAGLKVKFGSK